MPISFAKNDAQIGLAKALVQTRNKLSEFINKHFPAYLKAKESGFKFDSTTVLTELFELEGDYSKGKMAWGSRYLANAIVERGWARPGCGINTTLTLHGEQGYGKSEGIKEILPEELMRYYWDGQGMLNMEKREIMRMFATRLLIDVSELQIKGDKQQLFNALVTAQSISLQVHYQMKRPELPAMHALAVSTDKASILTKEDTGRRLGVFEIGKKTKPADFYNRKPAEWNGMDMRTFLICEAADRKLQAHILRKNKDGLLEPNPDYDGPKEMVGDLPVSEWQANIEFTKEFSDIDLVKKQAIKEALESETFPSHRLNTNQEYTMKAILEVLSKRHFLKYGMVKIKRETVDNIMQALDSLGELKELLLTLACRSMDNDLAKKAQDRAESIPRLDGVIDDEFKKKHSKKGSPGQSMHLNSMPSESSKTTSNDKTNGAEC